MNVTIPDSLKHLVEKQVNTGRYANTDAFIEDLVRTEAQVLERIGQGDALPVDEHFERRLEGLLDEAGAGGDYLDVSREDFDAMEREAIDLVNRRRPV